MNNPSGTLEGLFLIKISSLRFRLSSDKTALRTRTQIADEFKGFNFGNKGTVKSVKNVFL